MNNFRLSIVPVPVHFLKENSLYLIYEALLICADNNGYIDISNEELAEIIQKSSSSTIVSTSISVLKNIGVIERVSKKITTEATIKECFVYFLRTMKFRFCSKVLKHQKMNYFLKT